MARRINSWFILVAAGLQPARGQIATKTSRGESSRRDVTSKIRSFLAYEPSCFEDSSRPAIVAGGKRRLKTQRLPESEVFAFVGSLRFRRETSQLQNGRCGWHENVSSDPRSKYSSFARRAYAGSIVIFARTHTKTSSQKIAGDPT